MAALRAAGPLEIGVLPPPGGSGLRVLTAAGEAGELPILDATGDAITALETSLRELMAPFGSRLGIRVDEGTARQAGSILDRQMDGRRLSLAIVAGGCPDLKPLLASLAPHAQRLFREAVSWEEAEAAVRAGADGVVAKGNESGGRVGSETTFVLLQRLCRDLSLPVWAQGGIGPHAMAACLVAGAAGVLLDSQLALAEECSLPQPLRSLVAAMDGSETVCVGESLGQGFRAHRLRALSHLRTLHEMEVAGADAEVFAAALATARRPQEGEALFPVGQEAAFARPLAARHRSVGGILRAYRQQAADSLRLAADLLPLAEGAPLAHAHRTRFPIVQGPMTRVSDVPLFAHAVAEEGALPFLALALLREAETERLLSETAAALGGQPWGVGILGFVPPEIRDEQLRAVLKARPPFALLAGGRPDQAQALESAGIATYIHAPSVRLLEMFLREGGRRVVLEGRECGGHVGPSSSLMLWQSALEVLIEFRRRHEREEISVLFAGGIHDATSAAMVSALAAPAAAASIRIGVLMGTAYLFTPEAVTHGAIVPDFQEAALRCDDTVLLDMEGGHAIRCAPSPYAGEFKERRRALLHAGVPVEETRTVLEELNIGRLRIATKGIARTGERNGGSRLEQVGAERQRREGMYMIGQVAALQREVRPIAALHQDVSAGSAERLRELTADRARAREGRGNPVPIAIVGMASLFPEAPDLRQFWSNVLAGRDSIREVPPERWRAELFFHPDPQAPDRVVSRWGGFLDPVPFDPLQYGIPPASLWSIEPMQLLMLEVAQRALADAGYDRRPFDRERAGVVVGIGGGPGDLALAYEMRSMVEHYLDRLPGIDRAARDQVAGAFRRSLPELTEDSFPGVLPNVAAGRVANRFNLGGPNLTVDAACASSLAALEVAVKELRYGSCDLVLAGGVDTQMSPFSFLMFSKTHALSPTGRCRPFDARADGITISEGVAAVVLKRLDDAVRDGDRVYAVLRGVGGASDGRDKSLTAPSTTGQRRALARAYESAGVAPATVGLVEAHGTGTVVGDRTELATLRAVYEAGGARAQSTALGSVKSQIGHTKNAAGLAGLIKTTLALHHRVLPPTLAEQPAEALRDRSLPFYLNTRARPWFQVDGVPRRAAVSAFGFGGTNFHAVLEEFPAHTGAPEARPAELLLFQAPSRSALMEQIQTLAGRLADRDAIHLADLAAGVNRKLTGAPGQCRMAIVVRDATDLRARLDDAVRILRGEAPGESSRVFYRDGSTPGAIAFLFPGQGSQTVNMLVDLAVYFPIVRNTFERADRLLAGLLPVPLSTVLFPPPAYSPKEERAQRHALTQTWYAQPALGAADYALFTLLSAVGVRPAMVGGHSYGEYVALCAGGSLEFSDLIRLSEARGRAVQETQGRDGIGMAAVQAAPEAVQEWIGAVPGVHVAGRNTPEQTIVGGERGAIERFVHALERRGVPARLLPMSAGFHIPEARQAAERFAAALQGVAFDVPRIPVYSNSTARAHPADADGIRRILIEHLTRPVRFQEQVEAMYEAGARLFVEVGPGQVLAGLARQILEGREVEILAAAPQGSADGVADFLSIVGALFVAGVPIAWEALFAGCEHVLSAEDPLDRPAPSSTAWLIDGSKATPLGHLTPGAPRPVDPPPQAAASGPAGPATSAPSDPVEEVMAAFQRAMRQFLEYQEQAQQRRQRLMEQFLQTQREIVEAFLTGSALPPSPAPPLPSSTVAVGSDGSESAVHVPPKVTAPAVEQPAERSPQPHPTQEPSPRALLLALVSERTGYPVDMLDLDQNMEADLGIDSIKRTEIFSALRERLGLRGDAYEQDEYFVTIARLRTLREVLAWLDAQLSSGRDLTASPVPAALSGMNGEGGSALQLPGAEPRRYVVRPVPAPLPPGRRELRAGEVVVLVEDGAGIAGELGEGLRALGHGVAQVRHAPGAGRIAAGRYGADLLSLGALHDLRRSVTEEYGRVTAICHLGALDPGPSQRVDGFNVKSLFLLAQVFGQDLQDAEGSLVAFTGMGGLFGHAVGSEPFRSGPAGIAGFLKSLAWEWPRVLVKAIDVDPAAGREYLAAQLLAEVASTDRSVETGYTREGRFALMPVESD
ncbi:MAG TPA: beta-ketoacyl synthase N-terminal-like domain-containing protein, partial [bacterium]|nr:beta-ketoacyl synthase N-terminal-like domain-containing protein [bacterium]